MQLGEEVNFFIQIWLAAPNMHSFGLAIPRRSDTAAARLFPFSHLQSRQAALHTKYLSL
jgi:hypothetical protein